MVDHGSPWFGREKLKNLEQAGAADLPPIPFPSTMLGIVPASAYKGPKATPRQPRGQTVLFSPLPISVERIDRLSAFAWWYGDQRNEGEERRHEQRHEHPHEA